MSHPKWRFFSTHLEKSGPWIVIQLAEFCENCGLTNKCWCWANEDCLLFCRCTGCRNIRFLGCRWCCMLVLKVLLLWCWIGSLDWIETRRFGCRNKRVEKKRKNSHTQCRITKIFLCLINFKVNHQTDLFSSTQSQYNLLGIFDWKKRTCYPPGISVFLPKLNLSVICILFDPTKTRRRWHQKVKKNTYDSSSGIRLLLIFVSL